jgi:hypothetical protein
MVRLGRIFRFAQDDGAQKRPAAGIRDRPPSFRALSADQKL